MVKDLDIIDIPSRGFKFTWSNNTNEDQSVLTTIDHMFCNEYWKNQNPHFQLDYEAPIFPDHSPNIISIQKNLNFGPKPFKFMIGWMKHPSFKNLLKANWEKEITGNSSYSSSKETQKAERTSQNA